jgi:hypothetical protein
MVTGTEASRDQPAGLLGWERVLRPKHSILDVALEGTFQQRLVLVDGLVAAIA